MSAADREPSRTAPVPGYTGWPFSTARKTVCAFGHMAAAVSVRCACGCDWHPEDEVEQLMRRTSARMRRGVSVVVAGVLTAGGLAAAAPPVSAVPGPIACPDAFPTARAVDGVSGVGYTVERGTAPEPFTATLYGRITDGIAPGVDLIIAELDSPALRRAGGVWSGMSGSPVYSSDGRLIGAVAYGLSLGPSRVAGITPGADLKALVTDSPTAASSPAASVPVSSSTARALAADTGVSAAQAGGGFSQLTLPLSLSSRTSGPAQELADQLTARLPGTRLLSGGAVGAAATAPPSSITPGGNLAAALSTGDLTAAAVGTATLVCRGTVVGFGHPLRFAGRSSYSMHPASAVYVQEDPTLTPYKIANLGGVAGKVNRDRLTGIRGRFGAGPDTTPVVSTLTGPGGTSRTGKTLIADKQLTPDLAAFHVLRNADLVLRAVGPGSAATTLTVTGTRAGGAPFTLTRSTQVADEFDIAFALAFDVYRVLDRLQRQPFEQVRISSIGLTGSLSDQFRQLRVTSVAVKQGSSYVPLSQERPATARAGQKLPVRVTLAPYQRVGADRVVDLALPVPSGTAGRSGQLTLTGGERIGEEGPPEPGGTGPASLDGLLAELADAASSRVSATLQVEGTRARTAQADLGQAVAPYRIDAPVQVR